MGCVYGSILHKAGATVTTVCRSNYSVAKEKGIIIRSKVFGRVQFKPIVSSTTLEAAQHGPFDFIIVCSKAFPGTAEMIKEAVSPQTAIALGQNGIGIEEEYARLYPNNTIISGVIYLPVTQVEQGVVEHGTFERFEIGTYPPEASPYAKAQTQTL